MSEQMMPEPPKRVYFGGKSPAPLPWNPLPYMDEWLENLEIEEITLSYRMPAKAGLSHFATFCAEEGIKHPGEIERAHILRFQAYLTRLRKQNGEPLAQSYRQQILKYVRNWINWLAECGHISSNPWVRIKVGRSTKKPKPLEVVEVELLFEAHKAAAFNLPPFFFHRREVMLTLLYAWGLRIHELQALTVTTMDLRQDWVTAINKGGGTKPLPYADTLKQVVARYLRHRPRYAKVGVDALLIDTNGSQISLDRIRQIVVALGRSAGVDINPHRLRDTFGTTMLDHDMEVERLMKIMGHTQRSQTLSYARVNDYKVKQSHDRVINPLLERLLGGQVP